MCVFQEQILACLEDIPLKIVSTPLNKEICTELSAEFLELAWQIYQTDCGPEMQTTAVQY